MFNTPLLPPPPPPESPFTTRTRIPKLRAVSSASLAAISSCEVVGSVTCRAWSGRKVGRWWLHLVSDVCACQWRSMRSSRCTPKPHPGQSQERTSASRSISICARSRLPSAAASSSTDNSSRAGVGAGPSPLLLPRTHACRLGARPGVDETASLRGVCYYCRVGGGGGVDEKRGSKLLNTHACTDQLPAAANHPQPKQAPHPPNNAPGVPPSAAAATASTASIMCAHSWGVASAAPSPPSPPPAMDARKPTVAVGVVVALAVVVSWSLCVGMLRRVAGVENTMSSELKCCCLVLLLPPGVWSCCGAVDVGVCTATSRRHLVGLQSPSYRLDRVLLQCLGQVCEWCRALSRRSLWMAHNNNGNRLAQLETRPVCRLLQTRPGSHFEALEHTHHANDVLRPTPAVQSS